MKKPVEIRRLRLAGGQPLVSRLWPGEVFRIRSFSALEVAGDRYKSVNLEKSGKQR